MWPAMKWRNAASNIGRNSRTNFPKAFWPGPLTLVLPRAKEIPDIVTAGGTTVGVRWPGHPFIQAVIRECGFPLAAPSANLSNHVSPTNAEHVRAQLAGKIPLIVDGGQSQVGIESTVLDLTVSPPRILRPGMIHAESLAAFVVRFKVQSPKPKLRKPCCAVRVCLKNIIRPRQNYWFCNWHDDAELKSQLVTRHLSPATCFVIAHTRFPRTGILPT